MQQGFPAPDEQPAAAALLHLECELPAELRPLLVRWWEEFHFEELLTLPGFVSARRGHLVAPGGHAPIVTMYAIAEPAAADQPRPPEFTLMPGELDGKVTFNRRIMQRLSPSAGASEPVGPAFLQLLRPAAERDHRGLLEAGERVRGWSGVLGVSCWRSVANAPHTTRREVVHHRDTDLILAELGAGEPAALRLLAQAARELAGWDAGVYRQAFPERGVMRTAAADRLA